MHSMEQFVDRHQITVKALLFASVIAVCLAVCFMLIDRLGQSVLITVSIPVVIIAVRFGKWWGLAGALTAFGLSSLLITTFLDSSWLEWLKDGGGFGNSALIGVALLVGWLQDTRRAHQRLAIEHEELSAIARLVGSSAELGEIYPEFAGHVDELTSFDWIGINIIDDESQILQLCYANGLQSNETVLPVKTADHSFAPLTLIPNKTLIWLSVLHCKFPVLFRGPAYLPKKSENGADGNPVQDFKNLVAAGKH